MRRRCRVNDSLTNSTTRTHIHICSVPPQSHSVLFTFSSRCKHTWGRLLSRPARKEHESSTQFNVGANDSKNVQHVGVNITTQTRNSLLCLPISLSLILSLSLSFVSYSVRFSHQRIIRAKANDEKRREFSAWRQAIASHRHYRLRSLCNRLGMLGQCLLQSRHGHTDASRNTVSVVVASFRRRRVVSCV